MDCFVFLCLVHIATPFLALLVAFPVAHFCKIQQFYKLLFVMHIVTILLELLISVFLDYSVELVMTFFVSCFFLIKLKDEDNVDF